MTFRLFDSEGGGNEILVDEHLTSGNIPVAVTDGLVSVAIGSGDVFDGSGVLPGDPYTSLRAVFRDFSDVWVEIQIGLEVLSPRINIVSAGHALNANSAELLDDLDSSQFMRSDTSAVNQNSVSAFSLVSQTDLYVGQSTAGTIYFKNDGIPTDAAIAWHGGNDRFEVNQSMRVEGAVTATGTLFVEQGSVVAEQGMFINPDGPDSSRHIYFWEDGIPTGESFYWSDVGDAFYVTDGFFATGELRTLSSQIVINDDGPNSNQDIEFYNNGTQTERFQWDNVAQRFEVSDDFYTFGALGADIKNFVQNHPHREDLEIVYTSIEGNEVTTFTRGSGRLIGGEARIQLEESFRYVTNPDIGLSAHLTPREAASILFVESVGTDELVVRSADGSDVAFDFIVYGLRVGYEDHPVYRTKRAEAFAPPLDHFEADLSASPELRSHTALHRYREMNRDAFGKSATPMPAALELREAIGMRELNLDYPRGSAVSVREMNRLAPDSERERDDVGITSRGEAGPLPGRHASSEPAAALSGISRDEGTAAISEPTRSDVPVESRRSDGAITDLRIAVDRAVDPGDVIVIDPLGAGGATRARETGDTAVFGVVIAGNDETDDDPALEASVAVSGIVLCKVDAAWGVIRPGDLLTTSPTPGHAMRAENPVVGSVLGKALEPLDIGTGLINVLVTL
ncbi:MAG: hypothetical protein OEV00_16285, partial [Acidobacteriota bacterium]|nr:hypothetical protein [Acidobacteriota bacterium]